MLKSIALVVTTAAFAVFTTAHAQTDTAAAPPNDAQIAQIVLTADTVDVDYDGTRVCVDTGFKNQPDPGSERDKQESGLEWS